VETSQESAIVAVYGTLKRGLENHHLLVRAGFLGVDRLTTIVLYDLGKFPGARKAASNGIYVEVYAIDNTTLGALDELEEFDPKSPEVGLYRRERIATCHGDAWIYIFNGEIADRQPQKSGTWLPPKS